MRYWPNVDPMLAHHLRSWPSNKPPLGQRHIVAGEVMNLYDTNSIIVNGKPFCLILNGMWRSPQIKSPSLMVHESAIP